MLGLDGRETQRQAGNMLALLFFANEIASFQGTRVGMDSGSASILLALAGMLPASPRVS
ncbi:MAG: hypothetical protein ACREIW_02680 [Chthoniobacterales bacterium]